MSIELGNPLDGIDEEAFIEEENGTEYNMRELMDQVYAHRDIIVTIPTEQVNILKQGLITKKAKDNAKLQNSNIITMTDVLSFLVYPTKKDGVEVEGLSDVRIKLGPKKSVRVIALTIPNNEF